MSLPTALLEMPPPLERERIPLSVIEAIVQHIVENFSPDKIILFGSYAYGQPTRWSDVDLLVVKDVPPEEEVQLMMTIMKSLSLTRRSFGVDVIVRSQAALDRRIPLGDWFLKDITTQGKVMYERIGR